MKLNQDARELLDRYLLAVKRELTGNEREDITKEIESYIFDRLEEKHGDQESLGKSALEPVLLEMGSPRKIAGQYSPNRYLIGPRLFPIYFLVLKIIAAVVVGALTLSMVISAVAGKADNTWLAGLEYLGSLWSGVLSAAGMVTLIFAIIERTTEGKTIEELEDFYKLDLNDLPELPREEKRPDKAGLIIEVILGVIGITFFSYIQSSQGNLPYFVNPDSALQSLPFFTESFVQFIPFIIALAGLDIARNATILVQGYHSALTNWWEIFTKIASIVLNVFLIQALPLITMEGFINLTGVDAFENLEKLNNTGVAILLGLAIFGTGIDVIIKTIRELKKPSY